MHSSQRKSPARAVVSASLLLIGTIAGTSAIATEGSQASASSSACREEVRRVAVMPKSGNPKLAQVPQLEERTVNVCDGKVVPKPSEQSASNQESDTRNDDGA